MEPIHGHKTQRGLSAPCDITKGRGFWQRLCTVAQAKFKNIGEEIAHDMNSPFKLLRRIILQRNEATAMARMD